MSSAMVPTNRRTIVSSVGTVRPMRKQTCCVLKLKRVNHACILSNVQITKVIIKQTQIYAHSGRTALTKSGI